MFRSIARSTDTRTLIGSLIAPLPTGNSLAVLSANRSTLLAGLMNTFTLDWAIRQRMAGTNLNWFVLQDLPTPPMSAQAKLSSLAAALLLCHTHFAREWLGSEKERAWRLNWAITPRERLRCRAVFEALTGHFLALDSEDFGTIVSGCDHPIEALASAQYTRRLDTKGFWRYQKSEQPELRSAIHARIAFQDLQHRGLNEFLKQNDGDGWMLPETLRLTDYGLGHDDRAKEQQLVSSALGPRFYSWQLEQSVEESWEECERHAEILKKLLPQQDAETKEDAENQAVVDLFGNPIPTDLFGNPIYSTPSKKR